MKNSAHRNGHKKVVFLIGTRWFGVLGPCRKLIASLASSGAQVFVFGQRDQHWERYRAPNVQMVELTVRRSYFSLWSDLRDVVRLGSYVLRYRPTVIHSFNPKPALLAFAAALFAPGCRLFVGVTGLGNTFIRAKAFEPVVTYMLRMACKRSSYIFFQNRDDLELFRQKRLGHESKYRLFIGPGVDLEEFSPRSTSGPKRVDERVRIVCVARLIWQKGIHEFVECARRIQRMRRTQTEFLLVGSFDDEHPDRIPRSYIDGVVHEGVIRHVKWTDDLPGILAESDILVHHSYREGAPRAILEASAMELPTVASDAVGVRELVIDGVTGFVVPLHNVDQITAALLRLIDEPHTRKTLGRNARSMIAVPYSLVEATKAQLQMYAAVWS